MSTTQNEFGPVPDKITLHRIKVNPDMVTEWLESMQSNRNVSQVHVHSLARKMRTGRWVDTGETIKFDWNGCLIDGQHRCWGYLESSLAEMEFLVMHGLDPIAQDFIDTNKVRTPANTLEIAHMANSRLLSATIKLIVEYEAGFMPGSNAWRVRPDNAETKDIVYTRPQIATSVKYIADHVEFRPLGKPSVLAFGHYITTQLNFKVAEEFWRKLAEADYSGPGDPVQRLREKLIQARGQTHRQPSNTAVAAFVVKAWNAYLRERTIGTLFWSPTGERKEKFPVALAQRPRSRGRRIA